MKLILLAGIIFLGGCILSSACLIAAAFPGVTPYDMEAISLFSILLIIIGIVVMVREVWLETKNH